MTRKMNRPIRGVEAVMTVIVICMMSFRFVKYNNEGTMYVVGGENETLYLPL